jgi:hypothetical protein
VSSRPVGPVAGMLLLVIRGILLWVLVPVGSVAWLLTLVRMRRPLGEFLGWLDSNLIFLLERTVLRPLFPQPTQNWIPASEISAVKHRIGVLDPY